MGLIVSMRQALFVQLLKFGPDCKMPSAESQAVRLLEARGGGRRFEFIVRCSISTLEEIR